MFVNKKNAFDGKTVRVKRIEFSPYEFDGCDDLYEVYSDSSFVFYQSDDGAYFVADNSSESEISCLGLNFTSVKEFLNEILIQIYAEDCE